MEAVLASQTLLETMVIEEKSVMAATAMHDLQSPLHGIRNLLEFARTRPERLSGSDREHLLADMQASVDRMLSMVATTLAPMKTDRAESSDSFATCDVGALARRVIEADAPLAGSKGVALQSAIPTAPVVVFAESIAVEHILGNFLTNAVKFSAPGATIVISVEETAESICLSVEDEGPGIPEEDRQEIFSGKIRAHGARPTSGEPSSGLGLYLAGRLAERLGARISCEAGRSGGSIFSLCLPRE
jgi:signal transduction histidine kinase